MERSKIKFITPNNTPVANKNIGFLSYRHSDAKYLNDIPIVVDDEAFEQVVDIVNKMEEVEYMDAEWFKLNEELNDIVYEIYQLTVNDKNHIEKEMRKIREKLYKNCQKNYLIIHFYCHNKVIYF